jgi:hypothetical protein
MDGLTLLRRAHAAGLRVEAAGDMLKISGPKRAEPVVRLLAEHKSAVLAVLSEGAVRAREPSPAVQEPAADLIAPSPWFERLAPCSDGEPGLETPCAARRSRVQVLDKVLLHFCVQCGAYGPFGYGVNLRAGQLGRWYCAKHRP